MVALFVCCRCGLCTADNPINSDTALHWYDGILLLGFVVCGKPYHSGLCINAAASRTLVVVVVVDTGWSLLLFTTESESLCMAQRLCA